MKKEEFLNIVKPHSMTSEERIYELFNSLEYIRINNINGDFVECGVWRGGNVLGIMEYLDFYKIYDRNIWLYDTFNGMTKPDEIDIDFRNIKASDIFEKIKCYCSIDDVNKNLSLSNYPKKNLKYIVGDVNKTLENIVNLPNKISLLRLDTDWYESTKKELEILYPLLINNGVLIVDDYGHWKGSKLAVDEYFTNKTININYIDYTGIKIIKK